MTLLCAILSVKNRPLCFADHLRDANDGTTWDEDERQERNAYHEPICLAKSSKICLLEQYALVK